MPDRLFFNPSCSKCRTVAGILSERGVPFETVRYLDGRVQADELRHLMRLLGIDGPREMMRTDEPLYGELLLEAASSDELLDALVRHPILLQRPIVVIGGRAVIARPPERVLELLGYLDEA